MKRQKGNGWWLEGEEEADKEVAVIQDWDRSEITLVR